jgi:hypothetical protein
MITMDAKVAQQINVRLKDHRYEGIPLGRADESLGTQRIIKLAIQLDLRVTGFSLTYRLSDLSLLTACLPPQ